MTPLHWAIDRSFDNIAEILLENGANPYIVSKFLKTPYSIAKEKNNDFIINIIESLPALSAKHRNPSTSKSFTVNSHNNVQQRCTPEPSSSRKRPEKSQSFIDSMPDVKKSKPTPISTEDGKSLTLQMLKDQMAASMLTNSDDNLIQSVLQSGRKIMLSEVGKRLLNDSNLNKILKNPLNMPKKSMPATVTSESSNVLEIFRENNTKPKTSDLLDILRTASSSDFQEVTITQCSKTSPSPSPTQKSSGVVLSPINVPKVKKSTTTDVNCVPEAESNQQTEATQRQISELTSSYQQMKRQLEREQLKTATLARQQKQMEMNFENYKRQQNDKFDSLLKILMGGGNGRRDMIDDVEEVF